MTNRATGRPGVCFLITGPGVTNAATPMAQAYSDSVPILVISAVNERATLGRGWGELHELTEQAAVTRPFTAFSATAHEPGALPELVARAFGVFTARRPRPVHLEVPVDVFPEPVGDRWTARASPAAPQPDPGALAEAAALLATAKRPLLYVGGGARGVASGIVALAERLSAPVVTTVAGVGVVPHSHPLSLGSTLTHGATHELIADADAVLAIGTELSRVDCWGQILTLGSGLVRIDIDADMLNTRYPAAVPIHADAKPAVEGLLALLGPAATPPSAVARDRARSCREAFDLSLDAGQQQHVRVLRTLRKAAPGDAIFVGDMTQLAYTAYQTLPFERPGCFFNPKGYGTLGFALPVALGAKLGAPARAVIALVGDGGLLYTVQEMATALDEAAPIVVVLWNNQSLAEIRDGFVARGITPIGTSPRNPDFQGLARSFGWTARRARSHAELETVVTEAQSGVAPTLIELCEADRF